MTDQQQTIDRLRTDNEALRQALAEQPGYPKPGAVCSQCGQVNHRGVGFDGGGIEHPELPGDGGAA